MCATRSGGDGSGVHTRKLLRRGEFDSCDDLVASMLGFIEHHGETAKPFKWVYDAKVAA
jgi:hypothetical protein